MIELILCIFFAGLIALLTLCGMADQDLEEVANAVIIASPTGGLVRVGATTSTNADIKPGLIVKFDESTKVAALAQNNANPNSADAPYGIALPTESGDISTAFTASTSIEIAPLHCGATFWCLASGGDANSDGGWSAGWQFQLSINDAGMVMPVVDFATVLESTPAAQASSDAIQILRNQSKCYIGVLIVDFAGHATEDKWCVIKFD